jgi:lysophospholipase L1-like esterase
MTLILRGGERVLFVGDSNTDTEYRTRAEPLGYGYVMMVDAFMRASRPELQVEVLNRGNDGDTVVDLERRWESDVIALRPDVLVVMIGTNDVGYRHLSEYLPRAVNDELFERTLEGLVRRTQAELPAHIALLEPPLFELPADSAPNRQALALGAIVERIAKRASCDRIPVLREMAAALSAGRTTGWFQNVNHPAFPGHAFLAQQVLRWLGWTFGAR